VVGFAILWSSLKRCDFLGSAFLINKTIDARRRTLEYVKKSKNFGKEGRDLNTHVLKWYAECGQSSSRQSHVKDEATLHNNNHMMKVNHSLLCRVRKFGVIRGSLLVATKARNGG
jgi:hypothetical protein